MDPVLLSRIQFGLNAGFHFIFPPLTFGITLIILLLETMYLKNNDELCKTASSFMIKILGLIFTMGVATGIVLEFSFGTNWSAYSRVVGDIFGAPLAAEGVFSFFMESVFLGILVFGRNRVSRRVFWLSAFLVFFASHLSGLWIIIANSWMQTPAGYALEGGRAVLVNFFDAALNPSTVIRYVHVVLAAWITGSLMVAGICSWYILKKRHLPTVKKLFNASAAVFFIAVLLQLGSGHAHAVQVAKLQPEKIAAFEALWQTQAGAPISLFGIPDEREQKTRFEVSIPRLLSLLIYMNPEAEVQGLDAFKPEDRPPVLLPYLSYHVMIGLGFLFAVMALIGILLAAFRKLFSARWYHLILLCISPLPLLANEGGWIAAEVGRQPWAVYKVLRTADAASASVPAWQILFTIIMFSIIYALIFIIFLKILFSIIKKGPDSPQGAY
jgi:cytochrome d ubiquinol oxidase subunit I